MGTTFAIIHDETREAYDLGKGPWWRMEEDGVPKSADEMRAFVRAHTAEWPFDDAWRDRVAEGCWSFIEAHPGSRVVSEYGDIGWRDPDDPFFKGMPLPDNYYREVGSRHEKDPDPSGSEGE